MQLIKECNSWENKRVTLFRTGEGCKFKRKGRKGVSKDGTGTKALRHQGTKAPRHEEFLGDHSYLHSSIH